MVRTTPQGTYRGPFGPDPTKTRQQRESELTGLMQTADGPDIILLLYKEAKGIPMGTLAPIGTHGSEMVADILSHEYPNG